MEAPKRATAILDVRPMLRGSEKAVVEAVLGRRPGVERVDANPVSQTATVVFNPTQTSLADLRHWVQECGLHCAGQSVPQHICDPLLEPDPPDGHRQAATAGTQAPPARPDQQHPDQQHIDMATATADTHDGHAAPAQQGVRPRRR
jgi:Cu2+-exporting ATPase